MRTEGEWSAKPFNIGAEILCGDTFFCYVADRECAEHMVKRLNCHEELVALVEEYRNYIESYGRTPDGEVIPRRLSAGDMETMRQIDAVLAKVGEE